MVDRVERGTEVEKAEQGDGARVCRLVDVRHDLDCCRFRLIGVSGRRTAALEGAGIDQSS